MKQLENFFELDGKLLYAHRSLVAFDPVISLPIEKPTLTEGETQQEQILILDGLEFQLLFNNQLHHGPLRAKVGTRILHSGETLIDHSYGSMGHGSNFINGPNYYAGPEFALLLSNKAHDLRYRYSNERYQQLPEDKIYLMLFRNYTAPHLLEQMPPFQPIEPNPFPRYFQEEEIDCLREKVWTAELAWKGEKIKVCHSRVNGYTYTYSSGRMKLYKPYSSHYCLCRTSICFRDEEIDFSVGL